MIDEVYDVVDRDGNKIGAATWTEVHTKGLLHLSADVLIFKDSSKQEVLLQKRSEHMVQEPGKLQHSAGGHVLSGDTPEQGVLREIQEELFFNHQLPKLEIKKICTFYNHDLPTNHELLTTFETIFPGPFFFDPKEVAETPHWMNWENLLADLSLNSQKYSRAFHNIITAYRSATNR